ncbi:hypothetical protein SDC9_129965 [bioreactor metagenome]|uniref:Uncharacterized protein n=1 Tax=bioreactor metagenome TaxID=1076179 RepID=A0A645D1E0_9ZZZZ
MAVFNGKIPLIKCRHDSFVQYISLILFASNDLLRYLFSGSDIHKLFKVFIFQRKCIYGFGSRAFAISITPSRRLGDRIQACHRPYDTGEGNVDARFDELCGDADNLFVAV